MEHESLLAGKPIQFRLLSEVMEEFKTSPNGLAKLDVSKKRAEFGPNDIPPPLSCPAWLCCILPCLRQLGPMEQYNNAIPDFAHILRDGRWLKMDSHSIVPGDIIKHTEGDRIAADIRITEVFFNSYLLILI
jgi:hypothetical protein